MKKIGLVIILILVAVILSWATIFYYKYLKTNDSVIEEDLKNYTPLIFESIDMSSN